MRIAGLPPSHVAGPASAEFRRFEIVVGLNDFTQPILQRAIAAVRVRMMALYQFLEARLDLGGRRVDFESEGIERLALGIAHHARFRCGPLGAWPSARAELAQDVERIMRPLLAGEHP